MSTRGRGRPARRRLRRARRSRAPPVSSRTISRSTPSSSSGRSGDEATSAGWTRDRPQVGEQPEPAAQREQRLLRPDRRRSGRTTSGPPTAPSRTASAAPQAVDVLVAGSRRRRRRSRRRRRGCSDQSTAKPNARAGRVDDRAGRPRRPPARRRRPGSSRSGSVRGRPPSRQLLGRARRRRTPTSTPLISAPWSLLTATRYASSDASMMFVDNPWPDTTSAPGPSSDERRQRTSTWPWASSPADTALISYSVRTGCQPRTGWSACVDRAEQSASTGPLPVASARAVLAARP